MNIISENEQNLVKVDDDSADTISDQPWKILIADDDDDIHKVTKLALDGVMFDDRPLQFLSAYSGEEAIEMMKEHENIALILLDVVMEDEHAGLDVARKIREDLRNDAIRIVLRTGQPGQAPQKKVVRQYDINDYRSKSELTLDNLYTVVYTGLRMYHQYQQLRKREEELQQSNKALTQFAYVASHDLKAPLRSIVGFSQLLERECKGKLSESVDEYLEYIISSATQMDSLIDGILALSRLNTRQEDPTEISFREIVNIACKNLDADIQEAAAKIEYDDFPDVLVDVTQLTQLLQNLIANAIKFRKEGVSPVIIISYTETPLHYQFSVTDNGIGISADHQERIFQIFTRLHTAAQYPGTGIGLSVCQKIAERHGGKIWVESEPGGGCKFNFTLSKEGPSG